MTNLKTCVETFDSTLRDGTQGEGISFSVSDKVNIAKALDKFGIDIIEAGNPGSNPKDLQFFHDIKSEKLTHSQLCAFGSTRRPNSNAEDDKNIKSLLEAETPVVAVFGKSWDLHVNEILRISLQENLDMISDTVSYLCEKGKRVIFDAEHFFDGYKENPEYAKKALKAASEAGADTLCLCDTNGGSLPDEIESITDEIVKLFPNSKIAIHCHNDIGCAVACSLAAVKAGATQVQGTFAGYGERCGNAELSTIIANLALKCGCDVNGDLQALKATAACICELSNISLRREKPYVGKSAFAHKGGMHIDGVMKLPRSFEHIDPKLVGNKRKFLTSEVSGRGTVLPKIQEFDPDIDKNSPQTKAITEALKEQELNGYQYEAASASFELLVKKQLGLWSPHFNVCFFKTNGDSMNGETLLASAIVQIEVDDRKEIAGAVGNGPVDALDKALRSALAKFYPQIGKLRLTDYKVRIIDSSNATAAVTRVLIESTDGKEVWTTIGVSKDIIKASFTALIDSFEYILSKEKGVD